MANIPDWIAVLAVVVPAASTAIGGLGGYWLSGHNDEARDTRAAAREGIARTDSRKQQLADERQSFQRQTLLELQAAIQRLTRTYTRSRLADRRSVRETGQVSLLPDDLSQETLDATVAVNHLRERILDDQLRAEIDRYLSALASTEAAVLENRDNDSAVQLQSLDQAFDQRLPGSS